MASVTSEGVAGTDRRVVAPRLRAAVLGPRGGGTTRRRASDAFRLGLAAVVVAVSIPVMRANSAAELWLVHALNPPPETIRWLVTSIFWLGSAGVIVLLVVLGLLVPRLAALRWTALAALVTWGICLLLSELLGSTAGRPDTGSLTGLDATYPVTQLAVTIAVAAIALPYLSRPLHRLAQVLVALASVAAVINGSALPVNAISSLALGWGVAAGVHLAVGSPLGLPSAEEITEWIADLHVAVEGVTRAPRQIWGVEKFVGYDADGRAIELSVYGRDASDARVLAKLWRFCFYRDSGPTLILDRLQQVEHEAFLTLVAERAGVSAAGDVGLRNFRRASSSAPDARLDGDLAAVLAAMAVRVGTERAAAAAGRVLDANTARGALVHLQRSGLDPVTVDAVQHDKKLLPQLRAAVASATGIEVPKLAEAKRISWANLVFGAAR